MTWDELKEKAKEMGYEVKKDTVWCQKYFTGELFTLDGITFTEDGTVFLDGYGNVVAYDRTPEQMLMIMRGLE